jgi:hypothetical protein
MRHVQAGCTSRPSHAFAPRHPAFAGPPSARHDCWKSNESQEIEKDLKSENVVHFEVAVAKRHQREVLKLFGGWRREAAA